MTGTRRNVRRLGRIVIPETQIDFSLGTFASDVSLPNCLIPTVEMLSVIDTDYPPITVFKSQCGHAVLDTAIREWGKKFLCAFPLFTAVTAPGPDSKLQVSRWSIKLPLGDEYILKNARVQGDDIFVCTVHLIAGEWKQERFLSVPNLRRICQLDRTGWSNGRPTFSWSDSRAPEV